MPIYEFRCNGCKRRVSVFLRNHEAGPRCPNCGGTELNRLISKFAYHSVSRVWNEEKGPPPQIGDADYYQDPRNIGRWAEHRMKELGMDMRSEEYSKTFSEVNEMIDKAREGELPETIKDI